MPRSARVQMMLRSNRFAGFTLCSIKVISHCSIGRLAHSGYTTVWVLVVSLLLSFLSAQLIESFGRKQLMDQQWMYYSTLRQQALGALNACEQQLERYYQAQVQKQNAQQQHNAASNPATNQTKRQPGGTQPIGSIISAMLSPLSIQAIHQGLEANNAAALAQDFAVVLNSAAQPVLKAHCVYYLANGYELSAALSAQQLAHIEDARIETVQLLEVYVYAAYRSKRFHQTFIWRSNYRLLPQWLIQKYPRLTPLRARHKKIMLSHALL